MNCRRRVRPNGRLLFLHRLTGAHELPQAGSPLTGGSFFCTDCAGYANCVSGFAPNGRLLFLHRLTGALRLPQAFAPNIEKEYGSRVTVACLS